MKQRHEDRMVNAVVILVFAMLFSADAIYAYARDAKIQQPLLDRIRENPESSEQVKVIITAYDRTELTAIKDSLEQKESTISGTYTLGKVIVADIPFNQLKEIAENDHIKSIYPNREYRALLESSVPQIHASFMWQQGYTGKGVRIAILDTGIEQGHPMFDNRVVLSQTFTGENHTDDLHGHGTHVAGIAAGNGSLKGVAPGASLMNGKVLSDAGIGDDASVIAGINWAVDPDGINSTQDGADIISMSLGAPYEDVDSPIVSAIADAVAAGVVVVVASGNCGEGCPSSSCTGYIGVETPGIAPDAITVGAVDSQNLWTCFSSGKNVSGVGIKPDIVAPSVNINSSYLGGSYARLSGTSMATPFIAGAAALLIESNRNLDPEQVKYVMERTALRLGDPGKDIRYGSGLVDASAFLPPNIYNILKYRIQYPEAIYQNDEIDILLNSTTTDIADINATILDPSGQKTTIPFSNLTSRIWLGEFSQTSLLGRYSFNVSVRDWTGNSTIFTEYFNVIRYTLSQGKINAIDISLQTAYNSTTQIQVVFENTGNSTLETKVESLVLDNSQVIAALESSAVNVSSHTNTTFNFTWQAVGLIGLKKLRAIASFDGDSYVKEKDFAIIDSAAPAILSVKYPASIKKNNPIVVEFTVQDISDVVGNLTIRTSAQQTITLSLRSLNLPEDTHLLLGTFENTTVAGGAPWFRFSAKLCDSSGNCITTPETQINISDCTYRQVLVVTDDERENNSRRFSDALQLDSCVSVWDTSKSQLPQPYYLNKFSTVIWSVSQQGDNIDENASALLLTYLTSGGRLLLEGQDLAFMHISDVFMTNVSHSLLEKDLDLSNSSNISIAKTYPSPLFLGLPNTILYNASRSLFPDAVTPTQGGVELAKWNSNGSAIIAWEMGNAKTIFTPFTANALGQYEAQFIRNSVHWLTALNTSADLSVKNAAHAYLIEGANLITVTIANNGSGQFSGVSVNTYLDEVLVSVKPISIAAGGELTFNESINMTPGMHTLVILPNPSFNLDEKNYLNNYFEQHLSVAPLLADLAVEGIITFTDSPDVIATVSNIGGTSITNAVLEFRANNSLFANTAVNLTFGESKNITFTGPTAQGTYPIQILINPGHQIPEAGHDNNEMMSSLYVCAQSRLLIIDDDDTASYTTDNPSSADEIEQAVRTTGYCYVLWKESAQGIPPPELLADAELVIWSSGNHQERVLDENDSQFLSQYQGNILYEGSDLAYDHVNDSVLQTMLYATFLKDIILVNKTPLTITTHPILADISQLVLGNGNLSFPDSLLAYNSTAIANYPNGSAIIIHDGFTGAMIITQSTAFFGFAVNLINDTSTRNRLVLNTVGWLLAGSPLDLNNPPVLSAIGNRDAYENETLIIQLSASDSENNTLTYSTNAGSVLPSPFTLDSRTGVFIWTPRAQDAGVYTMAFNVSDGRKWDIKNATISVFKILACGDKVNRSNRMKYDLLCTNPASLGYALEIMTDNITLDCQGKRIRGAGIGAGYETAIYSKNMENATVQNCRIENFGYGIRMDKYPVDAGRLNKNTIRNNTIAGAYVAMHLHFNGNSTFENNTINNSAYGIYLWSAYPPASTNNELSGNSISSVQGGIIFNRVNNNLISENTVTGASQDAISLERSSSNTIEHNTISNASKGIYLMYWSDHNTFLQNTIDQTEKAMMIESSNINTIHDNILTRFTQMGMYLNLSIYNAISANTFIGATGSNSISAYEEAMSSGNQWDVQGIGNYWSDFPLNPGFPDQYEIPGLGGGIDHHPLWNFTSRPPVLNAIGNKMVDENQTLIINLAATDPDNDTLAYGTNADQLLPSVYSFNTLTGLFIWTPTFQDAGTYAVLFNVTDHTFTDQETISILVQNVNRPPTVSPVNNRTIMEGNTLMIDFNATDPDNDTLTYSTDADDVLLGAYSFNQTSGVLVWTPGSTAAGGYEINVFATDPFLSSDHAVVGITVLNKPGGSPVFVKVPPPIDIFCPGNEC
ncbi:MAG: S8 family serine peptidase [Nanoarchaeota archaeon]